MDKMDSIYSQAEGDGFKLNMIDYWAVYLAIKAQSLLPRLKWGECTGPFFWIDREFKKMTRWTGDYEIPISSATYREFIDSYYMKI